MTSRRCSITTSASRKSTPPPGVAQTPVRRSPRGLPRLNYHEKHKGTRSTSSMGSTGRFLGTSKCLKIQLKASLINCFGETEYCGSNVFLLSERVHRSTLHVRTKEILADIVGVGLNSNPVDPVTEVPRFNFEQWKAPQKKDRRKLEQQREEIAKFEAQLKEQRRARDVAQARAEKRKVGEPSVPASKEYQIPCPGELKADKQEKSDNQDSFSAWQVRVRSPTTQPSGAPS